jgi:hypothetical protein
MKLTEKISWLMGRVQRSLFPHLNEGLPTPLTYPYSVPQSRQQ